MYWLDTLKSYLYMACLSVQLRREGVRVFSHTDGARVSRHNDQGRSTMTVLRQLESHLWEAANILRGPVDAADFKSCVSPLLFFKHLSDAHDEEYARPD
jgi:hypothetical protein